MPILTRVFVLGVGLGVMVFGVRRLLRPPTAEQSRKYWSPNIRLGRFLRQPEPSDEELAKWDRGYSWGAVLMGLAWIIVGVIDPK